MLRPYFLLCFVAAVIASTLLAGEMVLLAITHMLNARTFLGCSAGLLFCAYGAREMLVSYRAEASSSKPTSGDQMLQFQSQGNRVDGVLRSLRSGERHLLTTRLSIGVTIVITAFVFALAVRGVLHPRHASSRLLPLDFFLHGWPLMALNIIFYAYLCWLAFWFVYETNGRERVVMAGWAVGLLIWPLRYLWPSLASGTRFLEALGLAVALVGAVSLFLHPQTHQSSVRRP